ncbi:unnamed protein product, partial [Lampetra planeri]
RSSPRRVLCFLFVCLIVLGLAVSLCKWWRRGGGGRREVGGGGEAGRVPGMSVEAAGWFGRLFFLARVTAVSGAPRIAREATGGAQAKPRVRQYFPSGAVSNWGGRMPRLQASQLGFPPPCPGQPLLSR